jgi:hypothetical protein
MPGQVTRTLADLRTLTRWYVNEIRQGTMVDSSSSQLDLNSILMYAYEEYARRTHAYPLALTANTVAGQAVYPYSLFSTANTSDQAGSRWFELRNIWVNQQLMAQTTLDDMDNANYQWRFDGQGTPIYWLPYGESQFMLYYTPSAALSILVEGYQTPDPTTFNTDTAQPQIQVSDRYLLAMYAAIVYCSAIPSQENNARLAKLVADYEKGMKRAYGRINNTGSYIPTVAGGSGNTFSPMYQQTMQDAN